MNGWAGHWTLAVNPGWVGVMCVLWLGTAVLCWMNWWRRGGMGALVMEGLRLVTVTGILFTLTQPERVERRVVTDPPTVTVLHDQTGSMQTRDVIGPGSNVMTRAQWLRETLSTNFHKILERQAVVAIESFGEAATATHGMVSTNVSGTDLNAALEGVLDSRAHLKAVLLLTDGDWNTGANPVQTAGLFRARRVPVFAVTVGSDTPLPDLVLEPVSAPAYGLLGEQITVPFRVRSHLGRDVHTSVALQGVAGEVARKNLIVPAYGEVQDHLLWLPSAVGDYGLQLVLPVEEGEVFPENNQWSFRLAVRTETLKVLVIDSLPRWEYRYLRNALVRDPGADVDCLLMHPGMARGEGAHYIESFPATPEALGKYDVVFLGDVGLGADELTEEQAKSLRGLVEHQASGLVFLPGHRGRWSTWSGSVLQELLPVIPDKGKDHGLGSGVETPVLLTQRGQGHFLTMLVNNPNRNATLWKELPGFYWCAAVERAKPGAEVLAVHPALRNAYGRMPLLATRPFGQGEVLFLGIDSAWRWRRGVEDKYHYRFWGQVVRWMAHKRHMAEGTGVRLTFTPEHPKAGDQVFLHATVRDLADWNETDRLLARVQWPSGKQEQWELKPVPGGWGVYQGALAAVEGGDYRLALESSRPGRKLETTLTVAPSALEKQGQPANRAILRQLAEITGGASGGIEELGTLLGRIAVMPTALPEERRFRLWSHPGWGGALLALLAVYWTARKAAGMI